MCSTCGARPQLSIVRSAEEQLPEVERRGGEAQKGGVAGGQDAEGRVRWWYSCSGCWECCGCDGMQCWNWERYNRAELSHSFLKGPRCKRARCTLRGVLRAARAHPSFERLQDGGWYVVTADGDLWPGVSSEWFSFDGYPCGPPDEGDWADEGGDLYSQWGLTPQQAEASIVQQFALGDWFDVADDSDDDDSRPAPRPMDLEEMEARAMLEADGLLDETSRQQRFDKRHALNRERVRSEHERHERMRDPLGVPLGYDARRRMMEPSYEQLQDPDPSLPWNVCPCHRHQVGTMSPYFRAARARRLYEAWEVEYRGRYGDDCDRGFTPNTASPLWPGSVHTQVEFRRKLALYRLLEM